MNHDNFLKTGGRCIPKLENMSVGPKFVELTAHLVFRIIFIK